MRWPRRRKGTVTVDERGLTTLNADTPLRDLAAACHDAGIDLEISASPERAKPDNPQFSGNYSEIPNSSLPPCAPHWETFSTDALVRPEPETIRPRRLALDELGRVIYPYAQEAPMTAPEPVAESREEVDRRLADTVREVRDADPEHPFTTQIGGVKIAKCDSHGITEGERAEYQRGLREGRLDNTVLRAEVVGSSEWLRDLADRLQQYLADRVGNLNPEHAAETPHSIRKRADEVERDEQARAASAEVDQYITDTAGEIADKVWDTFRVIGLSLPDDGAPTWLADGIESALRTGWDQAQADRAGRDDQEADRG